MLLQELLQEFQFGMNWLDYSRFVGDVFGPSLAIEALLAFFIESTFIGLWIFGWNRLSETSSLGYRIWLVSIGTDAIALLDIISKFVYANIQSVIEIDDGRAQMNDYWGY